MRKQDVCFGNTDHACQRTWVRVEGLRALTNAVLEYAVSAPITNCSCGMGGE